MNVSAGRPTPMTKHEFLHIVGTLQKGERICYHIGLLMADRQFDKELDQVAAAAWELAGMVKDPVTYRWEQVFKPQVILVQQRISHAVGFRYLLEKL